MSYVITAIPIGEKWEDEMQIQTIDCPVYILILFNSIY